MSWSHEDGRESDDIVKSRKKSEFKRGDTSRLESSSTKVRGMKEKVK